jgi:alpha-tubulin suppressor-like RCC1 family protein
MIHSFLTDQIRPQRAVASTLYALLAAALLNAPPALAGEPKIATGLVNTMAIKSNGDLWSWGHNAYGTLGDGTVTGETANPLPKLIGTGFADVSTRFFHTLALKTDGSLWAWGTNVEAVFGDDTTADSYAPKLIDTGYKAIAAGRNHSLALKTDGSLWAWGWNSTGQLGVSSQVFRSVSRLPVGAGYKAIAAGFYHSLAIKTDGSLWGWGANDYGTVGDGTNVHVFGPKQIGTNYSAIAAGLSHSVAIKTDGTLWTWGRNHVGQLGDGTTTDRNVPQQVGSGFAAVAAGTYHTVAVKTDGSVWTWGWNGWAYGQLGDGSATNGLTPKQIGTGYSAVAAGEGHSAAIKADGSLWTWGWNVYGQLGDGTVTTSLVPKQIMSLGSAGSVTIDLVPGWNLIGSSSSLSVATLFGDANKIISVWKWFPTTSRWAFYSPSLNSADLAKYAASMGYEVLSTANGGDGLWVNSKNPCSVTPPTGICQ